MLARKSNSESLLENFRNCLGLSADSSEDLMQQLYSSLMTRKLKDPDEYIALVKHKLFSLPKNKIKKIDPRPFLNCISASGVPLNNIKKIQARMSENDWDWITENDSEAFHIQTLTGTVLQVQVDVDGYPGSAFYSPRIYEMLQSSRLTQFR